MIQTYTLRQPVKVVKYNGKNLEEIESLCKNGDIFVIPNSYIIICGRCLLVNDLVVVDSLGNVSLCDPKSFHKLFKRVSK